MSVGTGAAPPHARDSEASATTPPASATPRPTDASRNAGRLAIACVVVAITPIVVAAVRAIANDWVPVGDNAFFGLRARDVLTEHHPLLGTWTSASQTVGININNPGPMLYDALAIPVKLGGNAGLVAGVALINVAAIIGIALVARRVAGPRGVVVGMAAAAALGWAMGSELLFDPWQPHSLLFPVLCFLVMAWALACGDLAVLPWAVGVASFVVQTHIGYALVVPLLGLWGVGAAGLWLRSVRRREPDAWPEHRRRAWRSAAIALAVALVCWSQSLYEQLFAPGRGNLGRLVESLGKTQETVGLDRAPRFVAEVLALPPWWARPSSREAFAPGASLPTLSASIVGLVAVAALLGAGVLVARRRADAPGLTAAITGIVVLVVALIAATTMPVGVFGVVAHHLRWLWPVAIFVTFAIVLPLGTAPGRGRLARVGLGLTALVTATFSVMNLPAMNARVGPSADANAIPIVRDLLPQLESLRDEDGVLVDVHGLRFAEPFSVPVMTELQELGVPWFVDDAGLVRQLGPSRRYESGDASVRLYLREGNAAREVPEGVRRVAFTEGLTGARADELEALKDELTPFLASGDLELDERAATAPRGRFFTARDLTVEQLRDSEYLFDSRALYYLVIGGLLDVPEQWEEPLERYAQLQQDADQLTVAVFVEPLEGDG